MKLEHQNLTLRENNNFENGKIVRFDPKFFTDELKYYKGKNFSLLDQGLENLERQKFKNAVFNNKHRVNRFYFSSSKLLN